MHTVMSIKGRNSEFLVREKRSYYLPLKTEVKCGIRFMISKARGFYKESIIKTHRSPLLHIPVFDMR